MVDKELHSYLKNVIITDGEKQLEETSLIHSRGYFGSNNSRLHQRKTMEA